MDQRFRVGLFLEMKYILNSCSELTGKIVVQKLNLLAKDCGVTDEQGAMGAAIAMICEGLRIIMICEGLRSTT